jgi:hypothetical protein
MILYHQSDNQIVFVISKNIVDAIADWFAHAEETHGSWHEFSNNIVSMQGGYTLHFDFSFISSYSVFLRVNRGNSVGFVTNAQASTLVNLENQSQHWNTTNNGEIIFSIPPDIYQCLENWENWNAVEALTPRYSYDFHRSGSSIGFVTAFFVFFDRQTKSLFTITWNEYEYDETIDYDIEKNINRLNVFIDRDYRIMRDHESIRTFYPGYERGIRIFHAEAGLACRYINFRGFEFPI